MHYCSGLLHLKKKQHNSKPLPRLTNICHSQLTFPGCSGMEIVFGKWKSDVGDNPELVKAPECVVRNYEHDYVQFGFIMIGNDAELKM